jgi:hypothetical protein
MEGKKRKERRNIRKNEEKSGGGRKNLEQDSVIWRGRGVHRMGCGAGAGTKKRR